MSKYKGFSLVELVVVILLIGILSAVAVPRLFTSLDKAAAAVALGFKAELMSTMKVLRAEWMLAGQPQSMTVDGTQIIFSELGFPTRIATGTEYEFCSWIANNVMGYSSEAIVSLSALEAPLNTAARAADRAAVMGAADWISMHENGIEAVLRGSTLADPAIIALGLQDDLSASTSDCFFVYIRNDTPNIVVYRGSTRALGAVVTNEALRAGMTETQYNNMVALLRHGYY